MKTTSFILDNGNEVEIWADGVFKVWKTVLGGEELIFAGNFNVVNGYASIPNLYYLEYKNPEGE